MFNSAEYSWSDIKVVMFGRVVGAIRGITYTSSQEKEPVHGAGNEPRAIQRGNKTYEGELTLMQSELEAMLQAAGKNKDVTDLRNVNIIVTYAPETGAPLVTDIIKGVEFSEMEKGMSQNDKYAEHTLPFLALAIQNGN